MSLTYISKYYNSVIIDEISLTKLQDKDMKKFFRMTYPLKQVLIRDDCCTQIT